LWEWLPALPLSLRERAGAQENGIVEYIKDLITHSNATEKIIIKAEIGSTLRSEG
jgi:hypothetical protein